MTRQIRRLVGPLATVLALATVLVAPSAGALSVKAAVPAAQSGTVVLSMAPNGNHTCTVLTGGQVKCWGINSDGQLGYGDTTTRGDGPNEMGDFLLTVDLGADRKARTIATGNNHTCVLLDNGAVKCWGSNSNGQLGYGDTNSRGDQPNEMGNNLPTVNLGTGRKAMAITAGYAHTCALLDNKTVKCWGFNGSGRLGYGDTNARGDQPNEMGDNLPAVDIGTGRKAKAIAAANRHTCALLDNNTVKCWGDGNDGLLGSGDTSNHGDGTGGMGNNLPTVNLGTGRKAKAISASGFHTCALLDNNTVKCWGYNGYGALGYGDTNTRGDNPGEMGNNLPTVDLGTGRKAKAVNAGNVHSCALLDNNTVKCWGYNDDGRLGYGDTNQRGDNPGEMGNNLPTVDLGTGRKAKAVAVGTGSTCALLDNSTVKCWGYNDDGRLGYGDTNKRGDNPGEMGDNLPAVNVGVRVRSVSSFSSHTCAILENRTLQCWGWNASGQLGYGDTNSRGNGAGEMGNNLPTVDLGPGHTVSALATGPAYKHTCAILDNGSVKCWGFNDSGQLGYGDTVNRGDTGNEMGSNLAVVDLGPGRKAKAIVTGSYHTCAMLDNGSVKCWGRGTNGQLGYGDLGTRGDGAGEMGNNLPVVNLGTGRKAKAIAAGAAHTCAILDNGSVKCWGYNIFGQLGYGDASNRGDGAGEMGNNLPVVNLGTGRKAKAITASDYHTCAILDNNTVKCWGYNIFGQLGYGDASNRGDGPDEMGNNLDTVDLGTGRTAKAISVGAAHTCALLDNKTVKCWGNSFSGQLGYGDANNRGDGPDEMGNYLPAVAVGGSRRVLAVSAGEYHTCALLDDYSLRCWGVNSAGELGYGDTNNRGDGPNEMGINLKPVPMTG